MTLGMLRAKLPRRLRTRLLRWRIARPMAFRMQTMPRATPSPGWETRRCQWRDRRRRACRMSAVRRARPLPTWRTRRPCWRIRRLIESTKLFRARRIAIPICWAPPRLPWPRRSASRVSAAPIMRTALVADTHVSEASPNSAPPCTSLVGRLVYRRGADYNAAKTTVGGGHEKTDAGAGPLHHVWACLRDLQIRRRGQEARRRCAQELHDQVPAGCDHNLRDRL